MTLWLGEEVSGVELDDGPDGKVRVHLASGKHIVAEKALLLDRPHRGHRRASTWPPPASRPTSADA